MSAYVSQTRYFIFFPAQFTRSFQPHYGLGVYSASNRNEYQKIFLSKAGPARKADNVIAICEPIV
jgi:hypothetical protein